MNEQELQGDWGSVHSMLKSHMIPRGWTWTHPSSVAVGSNGDLSSAGPDGRTRLSPKWMCQRHAADRISSCLHRQRGRRSCRGETKTEAAAAMSGWAWAVSWPTAMARRWRKGNAMKGFTRCVTWNARTPKDIY